MKHRQLLTISALLGGLVAAVALLYMVCKLTAPTGERASTPQAVPTRTSPPTIEAGESRDGGDVHYVAPDCGEVPTSCYTVIQEAVDAAHEGDVVKVAAGTYTGVSVRPRRDYTTTGVVTQVVYLDKSITIRGGYTVTNWTTPDPGANPTTLDAQGLGRTIYIAGRASPTVEGLHITGGDATGIGGFTDPANGNTGDAGGGVYVFTATATLRNNHMFGNTAGRGGGVFIASAAVTFTRNAVFSNTAEYKGGGVYLLGGDDALLDRNAIFSNAADKRGGGVFLAYSAATLSRNTVSTNTAYVGGGLSLVGSPATLDGNVVRANTAGWGGGLSLSRSDAVLSGNTVTANTAREGAGGLGLSRSDATLDGNTISANLGGGVYISWGSPTLRNNTITANVGLWEGSLYSAAGGGLSLYEVEGAVISRNEISHNTSVVGGGIYISLGAAVLDGNLIVANVASEAGGGVSSDGEVTLFNNVIADNRAGTLGSGLYLAGYRPCHILHTTIARNTGGDGSGIHVGGSVTLTNTILMSHTVGITVPANSTAALDGMLWGSGVWANGRDWAGAGTITTGTVNIWDEPGFVDPAVGDYHIGAGSPAADAGLASDISTDLDGDPRPAGTAPDIGADERPGPSLLLHMAASSALLSPGQTVSYTVVVTSAGVSAVTRAWLTATLPALQRATAITTTIGSCVAAVGQDEKITCDLGALPPGTRVYITMTVQVTTTLPPQLPWPMRSTVRVTAAETSNATQADTLLHACYVRLNDSPTEYPSIQAAVDASDAPGDVVRISGYCTGVTSRADARQMVYLSKTITIQGGWDASFTRRNAASFPTTLDARGQGRVLYVVGNISPTVEGLRITGGSAAGLGGDEERTYDVGGGVYILAATAVFRDNEVFGNTAGRGGGLYLAHSAARICDNTVISNTADAGGGLYLWSSDAALDGNTIAANAAEYGGGLYAVNSAATLNGNVVASNTAGDGGGLYLAGGDATLFGNTIASNVAGGYNEGGGVYLDGGAATLNSNTIISNTAGAWGGGLYLVESDATLNDNIIALNTAGGGGGLSLWGGDATLTGNTIASNSAEYGGGGMHIGPGNIRLNGNIVRANTAAYGGGVHLEGSGATLDDNTIVANSASRQGGGLYVSGMPRLNGNTVRANTAPEGGGLFLVGAAALDGNTITGNVAERGGGLYLYRDHDALDGNTIAFNTATEGGGLFLAGSAVTLTNNFVANNRASALGCGLYITSSPASEWNDPVASFPTLLHNTLVSNTGGDGSGITVASDGVNHNSVALTNTILAGHVVGIAVTAGNTATLEGMLWGSGEWANASDWSGGGTIITGSINVWGDPAFVDPADGDYHIGAGSSAFDTGVASAAPTDLDGDPRPAGAAPDIGADERPGASLQLHLSATSPLLSPGQTVTYTIVITSVGAYPATHVLLTDTLPALQQALAVSAERGYCTAGTGWGGKATCNLGTLAPGDRVAVTVTAQVTTTQPVPLPYPMHSAARVTSAETSNVVYTDTRLHNCHVRLNDSPAPYYTIQAAVDASTSPADVVKVAGTCLDVTYRGDAPQMVYVSKTLTIQGGWNISFTQRNAISYPTTLDARGQGRVFYVSGNGRPTIEGLTITGGDARGLGGFRDVWGNTYSVGGGVYVVEAAATFRDSKVFGNAAGDGGGGFFIYKSKATLDGNTIISNTAAYGGGVHLHYSDATLTGNVLISNTARDGGGVFLYFSDATLGENTVASNTAGDGGGVQLYGSGATLRGNTIHANTASRGGGLYLYASAPTLINNFVTGNQANVAGSGLYVEGASPRLLHNTIAHNTGSGLYVTDHYESLYSTVWLTNTILAGHETGIIVSTGSTATLSATLWGSGEWANESDWSGWGTIVTGSINVWGDPAFANPDRGDYHVTAGSTALDAGVATEVAVDVDGDARPFGDAPDLGADEWAPSESRQRGVDWQSALWAVPALEPRLPTTRRFVTTQQKRERPAKMPVILSRKEGNSKKNITPRIFRQGANSGQRRGPGHLRRASP